ncbi:hypothetical protein [Streptomyces sp. CLI2509]|uniref:hypothetical protein n=1 Tax=Streptomyces sp. CLI2509 TaxID=1984801 RepID=UPI00131C9492|nr:hypothetical protein [Streptomyces sp. CLI2509]
MRSEGGGGETQVRVGVGGEAQDGGEAQGGGGGGAAEGDHRGAAGGEIAAQLGEVDSEANGGLA